MPKPQTPRYPPQNIPIEHVTVTGSPGEARDHRKGIWFVTIVIGTLMITPIFPPALLLGVGAIVMLILLK